MLSHIKQGNVGRGINQLKCSNHRKIVKYIHRSKSVVYSEFVLVSQIYEYNTFWLNSTLGLTRFTIVVCIAALAGKVYLNSPILQQFLQTTTMQLSRDNQSVVTGI